MRKLLVLLLCLVFVSFLSGCITVDPVSPSGDSTTTGDAATKVFTVGEKFTYTKDGTDLYTLVINSVKFTDERNEFSDKEVTSVVVIEYTYENLAREDDLFISDMAFKVIDGDGNMCSSYPAGETLYPQQTPAGAKCTADMSFGLLSDKANFKMTYADNSWISAKDASWELTAE